MRRCSYPKKPSVQQMINNIIAIALPIGYYAQNHSSGRTDWRGLLCACPSYRQNGPDCSFHDLYAGGHDFIDIGVTDSNRGLPKAIRSSSGGQNAVDSGARTIPKEEYTRFPRTSSGRDEWNQQALEKRWETKKRISTPNLRSHLAQVRITSWQN